MKNIIILLFAFSSICFPQDFWEPTNGPYGGNVQSLKINSSGHIFIISDWEREIYRSTDNGNTWDYLSDSLKNVYCLAVDSNDNIFAGTSDGIYKSTQNGDQWIQLIDSGNVWQLAINPNNNNIFATISDLWSGIGSYFRSADNGESWIPINNGLPANIYTGTLWINSSGDIFTSFNTFDSSFFYKSIDNGDNWIPTNMAYAVQSLAFNSSGDIFVGTLDPVTRNGTIYRSTNAGNSWTSQSNGLPQGFYIISPLSIDSGDNIFAFFEDEGIFRSTNNGNDWSKINDDGIAKYFILSHAISPNGNFFAGTYYRGIFRSEDSGNNWIQINNGIREISVSALAFNSSGDIFAGTGNAIGIKAPGGIFKSTDNGKSWIGKNNGLPASIEILSLAINSSDHIFLGGIWQVNFDYPGGIFRSTDNGDSWTMVESGSSVLDFTIKSNGDIFVGTGDGIKRSTDNGNTWKEINNGLPDFPYISSLAINSNGNILAGGSVVYLSTNNGDSWIPKNNGLPDLISVSSLTINAAGYIFAGTYQGVFRSSNNGDSWMEMNSGLTNLDIYSLAENSSGHIFAATRSYSGYSYANDMFLSTDNGSSWNQIDNGLADTSFTCLAVNSSDYIFAGTFYNGVLRSSNTTVSVEEKDNNIPSAFVLSQNYPNPFNPSTVISYQLAIGSHVTLKVYDVLGNEIAVLLNEEKPAGTYEVEFFAKGGSASGGDAGNLSSGVYFYKIEAGKFVQTRKMILLR